MIRDPSDGTVKEKPVMAKNATTETGLRESNPKADYQKRLDASREWLKGYKERKASQGAT